MNHSLPAARQSGARAGITGFGSILVLFELFTENFTFARNMKPKILVETFNAMTETHHRCSFEVAVGNQSHVKSRSASGVSCLCFSSACKRAGSFFCDKQLLGDRFKFWI